MKKLTFTIKDGSVKMEASGFTGSTCETASKPYEEAIGGAVSDKKRKPEYHQSSSAGAQATAGGGRAS